MLDTIRAGFNFFIGLGGAAMMFFIITLLSLCFRVKFSKAVEGGLRMATALTGMSAVISLLTTSFGPALNAFVKSTGVNLTITDLGWAPLAVITWGSVYTLYFAFLEILTNLVMLFLKCTNTLNVDMFNIWNVSILGLLIHHYSGNNLWITSLFVVVIVMLMLFNADAIKPTINYLLKYDDNNITTTAHPSLLIMPTAMIVNKLIDWLIPFVDKFDFNADTLNEKIGFWGSKFAIGAYLGIFIGLLGKQSAANICSLAFTAGVALELFGAVGDWFGPAIEPLSGGIQQFMSSRLRGRKLFVAIDWPILASRAEIWAVANILAPIMLVIAMILPGNKVLPLGGIILTVLTPALLLVTRGRVIRMTIIGTVLVPLYLWGATAISKFITATSISMGNFPKGLSKGQTFSSIDSDPIEKFLAILFGKTVKTWDVKLLIISVVAIVVYALVFIWYLKMMKKNNPLKA
ncbi:PTS galactitol transporter subunit IIC [Bombilactobacillus folatiphilus]|uniref:PTS galactitol transporter subunit IIC n=1 Tax=Bombilactobacillus folatiphilus TaxID=2923362 RepID=A0ABY4P9E7_9LACO|nr:PTS transporter subunit IIC [Bombilactobacillus folatiphilus]UQS82225.1 PTS galactitol transporter subunit IIC [Bombilactobacillus folatiphilus]